MLSGSLSAQANFWTAQRAAEVSIFASAIAADGWATQQVIYRPGAMELNPLAAPLVRRGVKRQVAASILGLALGIAPSYALHRAGKERASRWWLHIATGSETLAAGYMLHSALH